MVWAFLMLSGIISINCLAARKFVNASVLATLRKNGQVAGDAFRRRDQHKTLMLFCLKIKPRNPLVLIFAGEIRATRQKTASHLISLPQAIVYFSFVLPKRFHSQIFSGSIVSF